MIPARGGLQIIPKPSILGHYIKLHTAKCIIAPFLPHFDCSSAVDCLTRNKYTTIHTMPEFEETNPTSNAENYAPSTDAKPRSRRRSGGFKKEHAAASSGSIGEIDPAEALRGERLSGEPTPPAKPSEPRPPRAKPREATPASEENRADPQPTEATLAAVKRVETRLLQRKSERDARHQARKPERNNKSGNTSKQSKKNAPRQSGGLFAAILKFFGLGPKTPPARHRGGRKGSGSGPRGPRGENGNRRRSRGGRGRNSRGSQRRS